MKTNSNKRYLLILTHSWHWKNITPERFVGLFGELNIVGLEEGIAANKIVLEQIKSRNPHLKVHFISLNELPIKTSKLKVSDISVEIIEKLSTALNKNKLCFTFKKINLFSALRNVINLNLRRVVTFSLMLESLLDDDRYDLLFFFGHSRLKFHLPLRPDVRAFYHNEQIYCPLSMAIARKKMVAFKIIPSIHPIRSYLLTNFRTFAIFLYKLFLSFIRLCGSKFMLAPNPKNTREGIAILIRGESEYWSFQPVLDLIRTKKEYPAVIFQDDLIKSPSGRYVLNKQGEKYCSLHKHRSFLALIYRFFYGFVYAKLAKRRILHHLTLSPALCQSENEPFVFELLFNKQLLVSICSLAFSALPELLNFVEEVEILRKKYNPKCFVIMDMVDHWAGILGAYAKTKHILSCTLQNASLGYLHQPMPISTDVMFVANTFLKKVLLESGADENRIIVSGLPMYDALYQRLANRRQSNISFRKKFQISIESKIILITTQPFVLEEDYNKILLEDIAQVLCDLPENKYIIIIKIHPREKKKDYVSIVSELQKFLTGRILLIDDINVLDLIEISSIFITRNSTTLLAAILGGVVSIAYLKGLERDQLSIEDLYYLKGALRFFNREDLTVCLKDLFKKESKFLRKYNIARNKFMQEYFQIFDGKSTERVYSYLRNVVKNEK